MVRRVLLVCLGALLSAPAPVAAQDAATCLAYEPTLVTLQGRLITRVYPGPPNYESTRTGDRPENALILVLARPICVIADSTSQLNRDTERDLPEIQLVVLEGSLWPSVRRLVGRRVRVTGTLFEAETAHHRTKVLITVSTVRAA